MSTTTHTLTEDEVKHYRRTGYFLSHTQLFAADKLGRLTDIFEQHLAEKGDKLSDELDVPHLSDERLLEFLLSDEAIDLVEPILGPNIGLFASHFICKDPFTGRGTPWHEDSAYWKGLFDKYDRIVTIWLALDSASKENGCMRVIPGTHLNGFSDYVPVDGSVNTFNTAIADVDESKAVYFELKRGECSLHDSRIIHGAMPNTSPTRRCGYTMRYFSTDARMITLPRPGFKIWLARGKDLANNGFVNG
jgi:hypothetical protein